MGVLLPRVKGIYASRLKDRWETLGFLYVCMKKMINTFIYIWKKKIWSSSYTSRDEIGGRDYWIEFCLKITNKYNVFSNNSAAVGKKHQSNANFTYIFVCLFSHVLIMI